MPQLQGHIIPIERDALSIAAAQPRRVFIGPEGTPNHFVFVDTRSEAAAWLKETAPDVYKFDTDSAEDDGHPMLVSTAPNTIIL